MNYERRYPKLALLLLFVVAVAGCVTAAVCRHPNELRFEPVSFSPPKADRTVLDNGIVVYFLEDHDLPVFDAVAYFRAGSIYEPSEKTGLAMLTGTVMRTGGTTSMTGDEIDEELEFMAGSVEVDVGRESAVVTLSALAKDLERGLEIFASVVRSPVFCEEKIDLAKKRAIEEIRRRYDSPGSTVAAEFPKLVYGKNSVWSRLPAVSTVNGVSRADLVAFHSAYFLPNNMILGVSGDYDKRALMAKLQGLFGDWQAEEISFAPIEPVEPDTAPSVNYIQEEINQSNILMGHLGIRRHNPDEFAVEIMNYILGWGGFTSRLWKEVRSDRGLAYDVYGGITSGMDYGLFEAGCQTDARTTCEAIRLIRDVVESMIEAPPSDDELALAKEGKLNRFVFNFTSSTEIVRKRVVLEFLGYPLDYLDTYEERIAAVKGDDVHRAAKRYLHPDKLVVLVVGDADQFDKPLSTFGPVNTIKLPGDSLSTSAIGRDAAPFFGYVSPFHGQARN